MRNFLNIILLLIISFNLAAANVNWERSLSIGDSSLSSSSLFDVISTTKGSRPAPVMSEANKNAISSPAQGLTIFNSTSKELNLYNNTTWTIIANTDQAQTFTNKTIVGTANSISGLRHGIEVDSPSSGVHGISGSVVGTTDTQSLSNKSILDSLSYAKISIPASPASGFVKLYAKSDDRFYKLDSSGNEKSISPIFTPSAGGVFVSDGTPDSFTLVGTGSAGQYLRSSGTSPPTWSDVFTFTPSAGNIFYSQGTPGAFALTTTGTPGQYLQSNGSSAPTWTTVSGGGGAVYTPSSGSIFYSDNTTTLKLTTVGTPGQLLQSNGSGTPSWLSQDDYNQNYVYNGDQEVWNEGTSRASAADGTYGSEGFYITKSNDAVIDINKSTSVPTVSTSNKAFNYSYEIDVTTADASIGASQYQTISLNIEGNNFKNIHQKQVTLSFWVYATKTGVNCISFGNSAGTRYYIAEYTVFSSNTWEYKTITLNLDTSGSWLTTSGTIGLRVYFTLAAGSSLQTTAGAWGSTLVLSTSSQVNNLDSTSNFFRLTGVKVNIGPIATPFTLMGGSSQGELDITKRYFQKSHATTQDPYASGSFAGHIYINGFTTSSVQKAVHVPLQVELCKTPSISVYDDAGGTANRISTLGTGGAITNGVTPSTVTGGVNYLNVRVTTTDTGLLFHYIANARL